MRNSNPRCSRELAQPWPRFILIAGVSGAGRHSALHAIHDETEITGPHLHSSRDSGAGRGPPISSGATLPRANRKPRQGLTEECIRVNWRNGIARTARLNCRSWLVLDSARQAASPCRHSPVRSAFAVSTGAFTRRRHAPGRCPTIL